MGVMEKGVLLVMMGHTRTLKATGVVLSVRSGNYTYILLVQEEKSWLIQKEHQIDIILPPRTACLS